MEVCELKRLIALVLAAVCAFGMPLCASAAETAESENVVYYEDGSYLVITTTETGSRASVKTAYRDYKYYDTYGDLEWMAKLDATFRYNGSIVSCTAANLEITIYNTNWYVVSQDDYSDGDTAVGEFTMGNRTLGVTVLEVDHTITITCDANGNLS